MRNYGSTLESGRNDSLIFFAEHFIAVLGPMCGTYQQFVMYKNVYGEARFIKDYEGKNFDCEARNSPHIL